MMDDDLRQSLLDAPPDRIAVLRYRFIGDTLLSLPFLKTLRRSAPKAHITLLTGPECVELMRQCPYVDEVVAFEPRQDGWLKSLGILRKGRYDRAYILKRSLSSALLVRLAGISERIGFGTEGRSWLLTQSVRYRPDEVHEATCFMDLLGISTNYTRLELDAVDWLARPAPLSKLPDPLPQPLVVLHTTSTNPAKCWPIESFTTLARDLINGFDAHLLFLGTQADNPTVQLLMANLTAEQRARCTNLCGKTNLSDSMALLRHVHLVVGNDSGMIHMAAAMNRPVVALFGPADPVQWAPIPRDQTMVEVATVDNLKCRPCRMRIRCGHQYPCMTDLTPQSVLHLCKPILMNRQLYRQTP